MILENVKVIGEKLILPTRLSIAIKCRYPFYKIPKLEEYSERIINLSRKNKRLPFYCKFDINNDGKDEVMIIQKSLFDKLGKLLIVSEKNGRFKFHRIKWTLPVNSQFSQYSIVTAEAAKYKRVKFMWENSISPSLIDTKYPHILTNGYLSRIVYWDGEKYCEEKITS